MTSSSMGVQLTPGQRCLLDLLQRKLLKTIQMYAKLSLERRESGNREEIDSELGKLKEKIRRISARQKRFTLEIINGNGNNTIPKECFFRALGLVTKEALSKLNSKTNERRRRTTANPRFSHEAIQAKKALEPLQQKRVESRVKDRREPASKKPQRQQQSNSTDPKTVANNNNSTNNNVNNSTTSGGTTTTEGGTKAARNQQALNNHNSKNNNETAPTRASSRSATVRNRSSIIREGIKLVDNMEILKRRISTKQEKIQQQQFFNLRLLKQNETIRKRGLDIISAINKTFLNPEIFREGSSRFLSTEEIMNKVQTTTTTADAQSDQTIQPAEPLDIWIDMKCDESLDGLD